MLHAGIEFMTSVEKLQDFTGNWGHNRDRLGVCGGLGHQKVKHLIQNGHMFTNLHYLFFL